MIEEKKPAMITLHLSLYDLVAREGQYQNVFRSTWEDKQDITEAAKKLNMSNSQYIKMIVIQASRKILAEVA